MGGAEANLAVYAAEATIPVENSRSVKITPTFDSRKRSYRARPIRDFAVFP